MSAHPTLPDLLVTYGTDKIMTFWSIKTGSKRHTVELKSDIFILEQIVWSSCPTNISLCATNKHNELIFYGIHTDELNNSKPYEQFFMRDFEESGLQSGDKNSNLLVNSKKTPYEEAVQNQLRDATRFEMTNQLDVEMLK